MSHQDWLSIADVACLWSAETGDDTDKLEAELEAWFSDFVARSPRPSADAQKEVIDTTNLLMGLLGGRHLCRETFAIFCEENGYALPEFWYDAGPTNPEPPCPAPPESDLDMAQKSETRQPDTVSLPNWNLAKKSQIPKDWLPPGWTEPMEPTPKADNWVHSRLPFPPPLPSGKTPRIAGATALGLSIFFAGFFLGHDDTTPPEAAPMAATASDDPADAVISLKTELAAANDQMSRLALALQASEREIGQLNMELDGTRAVVLAEQSAAGLRASEAANGVGDAAIIGDPSPETLATAAGSFEIIDASLTVALGVPKLLPPPPKPERQVRQVAKVSNQSSPINLLQVAQSSGAVLQSPSTGSQAVDAKAASADKFVVGRVLSDPVAADPVAADPADADPVRAEAVPAKAVATETAATPAVVANAVTMEPDPQTRTENVEIDHLLTNPDRYDAQQVVVTGYLLRLLKHYRLQSKSGVKTLVVDVAGLESSQQNRLQQAIAGAGLIGSVRAQIKGKVEQRGAKKGFRLVASDLTVIN